MTDAGEVRETMDAINAACRARGKGYSCKQVSWDDVQRGTVDGALSCWGGNITDTRLYEKSGTLLYTVRSDNWNEKLGRVNSDGVAIVVGNHKPAREGDPIQLKPITLTDFLKNTGLYANYAGVGSDTSLFDEEMDKEISIRFQTTFLPVEAESALEFCTEAYNYNTTSDSDPRNAVLLCTTQGIAFQQDGAGAKKLFHHSVDERSTIRRYWLEAERSQHKVGGAQKESIEEAKNAAARGKATASVIGTKAMGTRFNVLMTIQVPLEKQEPEPPYGFHYTTAVSAGRQGVGLFSKEWHPCTFVKNNRDGTVKVKWSDGTVTSRLPEKKFLAGSAFSGKSLYSLGGGSLCCELEECEEEEECDEGWCVDLFGDDESSEYADDDDDDDYTGKESAPCLVGRGNRGKRSGISNAARVSRGTMEDTWDGVGNKEPKRDASQHVTVTVVIYNTVTSGVPSEQDVNAAIDDMEQLYAACHWTGRLDEANFMKSELTVAEVAAIHEKIVEQPYQAAPVCGLVEDAGVFPTSRA